MKKQSFLWVNAPSDIKKQINIIHFDWYYFALKTIFHCRN